ncbi:unnamed protein product, partial [marine sediment metagenome]
MHNLENIPKNGFLSDEVQGKEEIKNEGKYE